MKAKPWLPWGSMRTAKHLMSIYKDLSIFAQVDASFGTTRIMHVVRPNAGCRWVAFAGTPGAGKQRVG